MNIIIIVLTKIKLVNYLSDHFQSIYKYLKNDNATEAGIEPATHKLTACCSAD